MDYPYGAPLYKPEMAEGNPIRLYSLDEITDIFQNLEMVVQDCCADFSGTLSSDNQIQLLVCSKEL